MTQQINGNCRESAPGVGEGSPGCKGFGSQGFWCLRAGPQGLSGGWSLVHISWLGLRTAWLEGCVPIPSINISSPWD